MCFCVIRLLRLAATLTRRLETAERDLGVWDFGAEPFRLQKIAEHISPTDAGFICLLPCAPSPSVFDLQARRTRLFCLTSPLPVYMVGWGGAQAFPRERITSSVCSRLLPLSSRQGYRLAVHTFAALPPGLPGQASELYYEKIR